jgi:hypothetical protein
MTKPPNAPRKPAPHRRRLVRIVALAVFAAFSLTALSLVCFVVVVMRAATQIIDAIFASLDSLPAAIALWMWACISSLVELLALILTGQWTQLLMRLFQSLGSP